MATGNVNKRTVDALKAGPAVNFLWDDDVKGFGVKITPAAALTYIYQYRTGDREAKTRRYSIGVHGSPWTPTTARTEAKRLGLLVAQWVDPAEADRKRRREAVDLAFKAYGNRFYDGCKGDGWRNLVERSLRLHIVPILGDKALPTITRADVVGIVADNADAIIGLANSFGKLVNDIREAVAWIQTFNSQKLRDLSGVKPLAPDLIVDSQNAYERLFKQGSGFSVASS